MGKDNTYEEDDERDGGTSDVEANKCCSGLDRRGLEQKWSTTVEISDDRIVLGIDFSY